VASPTAGARTGIALRSRLLPRSTPDAERHLELARGFGADAPRTWARESPFGAAEWMLMGVGLAIAVVATAAAVAAGTWNFILGPG
jgi:hypothetical protein